MMLRRLALLLLACTASLGAVPLASSAAPPHSTGSSSIALRLNSRGAMVTMVQSRLQQLGFYDGAIDGVYGSSTKTAVQAFQRSAGLDADGQVGVNTWQQLELASLRPLPPSPPAPVEASPSPEPPLTAAAIHSPAVRLTLLLAVVSLAGALHLVLKTSRKPSAWPATVAIGGETAQTQSAASESPSIPAASQVVQTDATLIDRSNPAAEAVQETTRLPKFDIAAELLRDLHSVDPALRRRAIWELGQRGESQAIQPLVDLLIDSDSQQRSLILAAIAEIGSRTLKPMQRALMISLQDESADVRKNAIRDLTRVYDSIAQTSQLLAHAVNDSDAEVQETARWALNQLNRIRATAADDAAVLLANEVVSSDRSTSTQ